MIARLKELLFQNRSTKQTVAKNMFWLSMGEVISRLFRGVVIIYAARILGANGYGVFSYALGLAGFFTIFADIGLTSILTREVSQKPDKKSQYLATTFWIKTVPLSLTALLVVFVAPYFSNIEAAKALVPIVAFLVIFDGIREFSLGFLRANDRMEIQALITLITNITISLFGILILFYYPTAKALTFAYALSAGSGALASVIILRNEFLGIFKNFNKELIKPILDAAWPFAFISLLGGFMLSTDIIMLGWFKDAREVGLYSAGQKVVSLLYVLPGIFVTSVFPTISRLIGNSEHNRVRNLTEKSIVFITSISFPLTVGGIVLGNSIISFLFGPNYSNAVLPFQILMLTIFATYSGSFIGNLILAYNLQKKAIFFVGLASLSNFVFDALLIPFYGGAGSAVATVIAQILITGLGWHIVKKKVGFNILPHLTKIIPATIIMGIISYIMDSIGINVTTNICVSMLLYFAILYASKEIVLIEIFSLIKKI
ncbi:MAG: flippase [bacterium]|nr:flippase [bacterium]